MLSGKWKLDRAATATPSRYPPIAELTAVLHHWYETHEEHVRNVRRIRQGWRVILDIYRHARSDMRGITSRHRKFCVCHDSEFGAKSICRITGCQRISRAYILEKMLAPLKIIFWKIIFSIRDKDIVRHWTLFKS